MTEELAASLQSYLDTRLPRGEGMVMIAGAIADHVAKLTAAERPAIAKAVDKRRREFATGRYLAKQAMARIGVSGFARRREGHCRRRTK